MSKLTTVALESPVISYSSFDSSIVAVSSTGKLTAKSVGTAVVTVTIKSGTRSAIKTIEITVNQAD